MNGIKISFLIGLFAIYSGQVYSQEEKLAGATPPKFSTQYSPTISTLPSFGEKLLPKGFVTLTKKFADNKYTVEFHFTDPNIVKVKYFKTESIKKGWLNVPWDRKISGSTTYALSGNSWVMTDDGLGSLTMEEKSSIIDKWRGTKIDPKVGKNVADIITTYKIVDANEKIKAEWTKILGTVQTPSKKP